MPFSALRFKKIRRYDVATKTLFVLSVQLLDNTEMECTLNEGSTGEELLSHIAQRLNIREYGYFGLKFINKHLQYQWLALDLPLKRQLTKFAHSLFVKFSVRFYIKNVNQLKDESTRYQFFLQLRNEIIEGALLCSPEQAVLLASYSLQAAYGDFDPDRHAPHHLKDFFLLPKRMSTQDEILMDLLKEVSNTHRSFQGMSPAAAEMYYITEAQSLEGYGEEYYAVKDNSGNDLLLGTSHSGITIKHPTGRPLLSISWSNLKTVTRNKRSICLECVGTGRTNQRMVQIFLENQDFAAYVLTNITLQQDFYISEPVVVTMMNGEGNFPLTGNGALGRTDRITHPQAHPYRLMFRPDGTGMNAGNLKGTHLVPEYPHSQPDVVDFTRHALNHGYGAEELDPVESETSEALVYRESPSYDEVMRRHVRTNGHSLDILDQGLSHPRTHITHRFSWMNPSDIPTANGHVPNHYLATPFPPELTRIQHQSNHIGPLTNSTPELRTSGAVKPSQLNPPLSCSTPDLLSMTGPVPARRVLVRRPEQNDVFVSHSQELPMVRQTAVDDLTVSTFPNGNGLVADKSKHFDAVVEEDVPRSLSVTPLENGIHGSKTPKDNNLGSPNRPLLLAAMNGLVLSNVCLVDVEPAKPSVYANLKDARRADLEQRLSSGNVLIEFEQIPKKRHSNDMRSCAKLPENHERNRFSDVLPYDDTRIQLRKSSKNNPRGYINASQIVLECGDLERRYIAAQDPLPNTVEEFLQMIVENHVRVIVILSENSNVPWRNLPKGEISAGGFSLKRENTSKGPGYSIISFSISSKSEKISRRKVWALHYEAWEEQGIPSDPQGFMQMVRELESLRLQFQQNPKEKVVVVCKTGAGRSGMLILYDFMALCLDHNQAVDVPRVLAHMRRQRMFMVQTVSQYRFVYAALVRHLNSSRLI